MAACDHEIEAQLTRFEDKSGGLSPGGRAPPAEGQTDRTRLRCSPTPPLRRGRRPHPDQWHRRPHGSQGRRRDRARHDPLAHGEALRLLAQPLAWQPHLGGKKISGRTKASANRVAAALRLAASSLYHSKSALGAFHRRLKARLGAPKAIIATAHKLARLIYRMLRFRH